MKRTSITRRGFMKGAAAGVAGLSLGGAAAPTLGAWGANEKVVIGFIGTGGQGTAHVGEFAKMKDVAIAAVCDVDRSHRENAAKVAGSSPKTLKDFRELLDMKDIDAVLIATPGHWHVVAAIAACKAGKDVYCEKPVGLTIREGRALVDVAKEQNRVTQIGTQQRTTKHWANAVNRIKAGELGKISMIHVWNAWTPKEMFGNIGNPPDADPPPGVDYDMWLGPAPKRRFNPARFHGTHYFFWDYGSGMVNDWGTHLFDVVLWAMGPEIKSVAMSGGKLVFDDARDTPDTAGAVFECPGYTMLYTMRHGNGWQPHGNMDHGIQFYGTEATLEINRNGFQMYHDADRGTRKPFYTETGTTWLTKHERNFIECVRTRKRTTADAEVGHQGAIPGHLANISYRVGRKIRWDHKNETILDDSEANQLLTREYRTPWHL
jgi:predicted dehydrogenase